MHVYNIQGASEETQRVVINSLESTLRKLEKSLSTVMKKDGNTQLVTKRRDAVQIGYHSLVSMWKNENFDSCEEIILSTQTELHAILRAIEKQLVKAKKSSAQQTLNERRHLALTLAIVSLEARLSSF